MPTARMTFSVPPHLKRRAQAHRDVNWSGVVAKALAEKLNAMELADRILRRSRLTEKDVDELSKLVDEAMAKRFGVQ